MNDQVPNYCEPLGLNQDKKEEIAEITKELTWWVNLVQSAV